MPTYEYACNSCGQHLEVVQSFTDDSLTECPNCGGPLRKVFGNIGIVLKGSGFYKTDSRPTGTAKKGAREGGDSAPAAAADSSGGGTTGTDAKSSDTKSPDTKSADTKGAATPSTSSGDGPRRDKGGGGGGDKPAPSKAASAT